MDTIALNTSCCCFNASDGHTFSAVTARMRLAFSCISLLRCDLRRNAPVSLCESLERGYVQWYRKDIQGDWGQIR